MISFTTFAVIMIAHFVADFVMQTDKMAKGKSTGFYWLSQHILAYTLWLGSGVGYYYVIVVSPDPYMITGWIILNGLLHGFVDYFTSRWTSRLWEEGRTHDFFVVIGLDQTIHILTLIGTYILIFN